MCDSTDDDIGVEPVTPSPRYVLPKRITKRIPPHVKLAPAFDPIESEVVHSLDEYFENTSDNFSDMNAYWPTFDLVVDAIMLQDGIRHIIDANIRAGTSRYDLGRRLVELLRSTLD
jgi:hypothetical protein